MLKTSPIITTSANASPTSFRYAPPSSPSNPIKPSSAIRRRESSRSASAASSVERPMMMSPHHPRSRSATIGADSRGSPMDNEPTEPCRDHDASSAQKTHESPCIQPGSNPPGLSQAAVAQQPQMSQAQNAVSPNKRRSSPGPSIAQATMPGSQPQTTKRPKPATPPPKILPKRYEFCAVEDMVELISHMLAELIATNDAIRVSTGGLTRFHSRTAPGISVRDYLHRLARHATLTPPLLLAMVYYIDRLCALYSEFTINTLTVHRFLITAATVAAKGLSDSFWNNTTYARVGGVRVAELKLLELEFLYRVDWKIVPNPEVLVAYYKGLVERCPGYELESTGSDDEDEEDDEEIEEEGDLADADE